jgi:hypothetical protein
VRDRLGLQPALQLQRAAGNRAVGEALELSQGGEAAEREANRMADRVVQRSPSSGEAAKAAPAARGGVRPPEVLTGSVQSAGQPMDPATRARMEAAFHTDFSRVRVHTGERAAHEAKGVGAAAFTIGRDMGFAARRYQPGTTEGGRLLAHELTHVVQQSSTGPTLQCAPDKKSKKPAKAVERKAKQPAKAGEKQAVDLGLPWTHGDYSLFEESSSGIRFLVGIAGTEEATIRAAIPAIGKRIADDNKLVKDPAQQVLTCIIAVPTTTRFAHWQGTPVLMLEPKDVNLATAAHEMGHAVFHYLKGRAASKEKDAGGAGNFRLMIGDIYARLSTTKEYTFQEKTIPAGLWIADPSQVSPGSPSEHPWQDPDEFFASAKAAFQVDRKGFEASIARFTKHDPAVAQPAKELMALLEQFLGKTRLPAKPSLSKERTATAKSELEREKGVSKVEETIMPNTALDWLLRPESRPQKSKPRPSLERP